MPDATLNWGGDLAASPTGDIAVSSNDGLVQERLLRRLLTNPGDYIWQRGYGAGVGEFIGVPCQTRLVTARVRSQVFLEPFVSQSPQPTINIDSNVDGEVFVRLRYTNTSSGVSQFLTFSVSK